MAEGHCHCGQDTDEVGPGALCAYHRDLAEGLIADECECAEAYTHRGWHTPGCPMDDGERMPI